MLYPTNTDRINKEGEVVVEEHSQVKVKEEVSPEIKNVEDAGTPKKRPVYRKSCPACSKHNHFAEVYKSLNQRNADNVNQDTYEEECAYDGAICKALLKSITNWSI